MYLQVICVVFVCAAFTLDIFCLIFVPLHWLFFVASTYVLFNYIWHTGEWLQRWLLSTVVKRRRSKISSRALSLSEQRKASAYRQRPCGFCWSTRRLRFASKTWRPLTPTCLTSLPHTGVLMSCTARQELWHFPDLKWARIEISWIENFLIVCIDRGTNLWPWSERCSCSDNSQFQISKLQ